MIGELRFEAVVGAAFLSVIPRRHGDGRNGAAQHRGGDRVGRAREERKTECGCASRSGSDQT